MSKLGIDLWGILWQLVAFGILLFFLHRLMYRPTLRIVDERAARVREGMENAELARRRAEQAQLELDRSMEQARRRSQEVIEEATRAGEKVRQEMLEQARQEAARLVAQAREQAELEQRQALAAVKGQIVDLSIEAARRVLQQGLTEDVQRRLLEQFLSEQQTSGADEG
ncbi:MAG: F0F1 ATP synthase subunit B [Anaerolineae bacterium]|nr:F0F1 ATP synthase subunit B [Anaerolineae bacterium]